MNFDFKLVIIDTRCLSFTLSLYILHKFFRTQDNKSKADTTLIIKNYILMFSISSYCFEVIEM